MSHPEPRRKAEFDFERLIVYQKSLALLELLAPFTAHPPKKAASPCDHLDRAMDSILFNVPEGAGRASGSKDRRHFYRIALGSAKEAASVVIVLHTRKHMGSVLCGKARILLLEIVSMLTSMSRE